MITLTPPPRLAVFPLPVFLLPDGITKLRIFEQRYLRMVKEASSGSGFVLSLFDNKSEFNSTTWGCWVKIINFSTLDDGFLSIDIQGQSLVNIGDFSLDDDGLRQGDVSPKQHWPKQVTNTLLSNLAQRLALVYQDNPGLNALYENDIKKDLTNPNWVCSRWLEILPISNQTKKNFVDEHSFSQTQEFLQHVVLGS